MGLPVGMGFLTEVVALFPNSTEVVVAQQCEYTNPTGLTVHSKIISFMIYNFTRTKKKSRLTHRKGFWHMGHIKVVFSFSSIFIRQSYYGSLGGNDWAVGDAQSQNPMPALRGIRQGASKTRAYLIIS